MATALKSKIRICKGIKLDKEYNNVLDYSESDMLQLCESQSHLVASANDYSFIRNRGTILVDFTYTQCLQANYMAFQNKDYDNKWFFAFIDDVHYINDGATEIEYTIDAWSTWWDNWTRDVCFVIREHVDNDTIGLHTVPENLETGEYITQSNYAGELFTYLNNTYICIAVSEIVMDTTVPQSRTYNGLYSGLTYLIFPNETNANAYINYVNKKSKNDAIYNIFIIPASIVSQPSWTIYREEGVGLFEYDFCPSSNTVSIVDSVRYTIPTTLDNNYVPKNNKLFVFPYRYFNISNNSGQIATYKYEDFDTSGTNGKCDFTLYGSISSGCSMKLMPAEYKKDIRNEVECIDAGKLPTVSWVTDPYTNWLTQNGVNLAIQTGVGLAQIGIGVATGIASGGSTAILSATAITSGISTISNSAQQVYEHSIQPKQAQGGANQGDYNFCDKLTFTIQRMTIKEEYARIIDDYFTRKGYKINRLKIPNFYTRTYWNYIQIDANDEIGHGNVPNKYMEYINNIARKGVTIWHSHDNIGDFSLNNTIVS